MGKPHAPGRRRLLGLLGVLVVALAAPPVAAAGSEPQTIDFHPPMNGSLGDSVDLSAKGSATSGLPLQFSAGPSSVCLVAGVTLSFAGLGTCTVTAKQAGDATYAAATAVSLDVEVQRGMDATYSVTAPGGAPRTDGTIRIGDRIAVAFAAADGTPVTSCTIRLATAGGWIMDRSGKIVAGRCELMTTLPPVNEASLRMYRDRVDLDLCVMVFNPSFEDLETRVLRSPLRSQPGGVTCYNGGDRTYRWDEVLDFELVEGGTPQPFVSDPPMVPWDLAAWPGFTPLRFNQVNHLELPADPTTCYLYLNGSEVTTFLPAREASCSPWDVRLPGVLPSNLPWGAPQGDWYAEVIAEYGFEPGDAGWTIAQTSIPFEPSDGVYASNKASIVPTDLAATRFVTAGDPWAPRFQVDGTTLTSCAMAYYTVPPTFPDDPVQTAHHVGTVEAGDVCSFDVPALVESEGHQYHVTAQTPAGEVAYGAYVLAIPPPAPPVIEATTGSGGAIIDVTSQGQNDLVVDVAVPSTPASTATGATPALGSCSGQAVTGQLLNGGSVEPLHLQCLLPPGKYKATATAWDAAGSSATATRTFTVPEVSRLAGADRFATAAAISRATFTPGVPVVYIATGRDYPDALAGAAAAGTKHAPILLVDPTRSTLPAATAAELTRLRPGRILILGGNGAVPLAIGTELKAYTTGKVTRIAGADRFATAAAISKATFAPGVPTVYIATGRDYPDALAGAAAAGTKHAPILLVDPARSTLPAATIAELTRLQPGRILILGGNAAVPLGLGTALKPYTTGKVTRVAGPDRFATAAAISAATFPPNAPIVYIATGRDYPDALAGAAAAGARHAPILLVDPARSVLPSATVAELTRLNPKAIAILGGAGAVPLALATQLQAFVAD